MGLFDGLKKALQDSKDQQRLKQGKYVPPRDPAIIEQKKKMLESLSNGNLTVIQAINPNLVSVILKKNEICYTCINGAQLWEDRAVRVTTGGYGGPRIRVAKGVSFGMGGFGAKSVSHDERKLIDNGTFIITNTRVVFAGKSKTIEFPLNKVVSVDSIPLEGIVINRSNKQKTEYYLGGFDGDTVSAVIEGLVRNLP
ncbi:MAG: hypothetical protein NTY75_05290 [Candidatus Shapirobacteria bacterium]|nr:hypothetical protein [Candidatus Shapirobacteria bacterium]